MTYAETPPRSSVYSSIVPPPRTPVGPSMDQHRKPPNKVKNGANSLDYWNKTEDEKSGVTCYYSRHNMQIPTRLVNRMNHQPGRPSMINQSTPRYPGFPPSQPENVMSPPVAMYRNVPAMPRAKLSEKKKNGGGENVVWGGRREEWNEEAGTSALVGKENFATSDKKRANGRRKSRMARCLQTLFCCVTPPREIEKIQSNSRTSNNTSISNGRSTPTTANNPPIQLITQVHRDGTVTGLPPQNLANGGAGDGPQQQKYDKSANSSGSIIEKPLLPPLAAADAKRKCLVIDLDETLVHSSFKPVKNPDFVIPVEIDGVEHQVYVLKRPYVDEFLAKVGEMFECILFTASLAKYADPVADLLDKKRVFRGRLFREACVLHKGNYVKDLSRLGRDLKSTIIIDNSPASYAFHPENAIGVGTWFDDPSDTELMAIIPTLEKLDMLDDIYDYYRPEEGPNSEALLLNHCSC